jgi:hypothetical protein
MYAPSKLCQKPSPLLKHGRCKLAPPPPDVAAGNWQKRAWVKNTTLLLGRGVMLLCTQIASHVKFCCCRTHPRYNLAPGIRDCGSGHFGSGLWSEDISLSLRYTVQPPVQNRRNLKSKRPPTAKATGRCGAKPLHLFNKYCGNRGPLRSPQI